MLCLKYIFKSDVSMVF